MGSIHRKRARALRNAGGLAAGFSSVDWNGTGGKTAGATNCGRSKCGPALENACAREGRLRWGS